MPDKPSVFISYSHADEAWKDKLAVQLGVLAKENRLEMWDDRRIAAGDEWFPEIEQALNAAQVAVLLISGEFLISSFIRGEEMPRLLARRQCDSLRIVPILVRPCPWKQVEWLAKIQMRPRDGREIAGGTPYQIDKDFASIAEEIGDLIGAARTPTPTSGARTRSSNFDLSELPATGQYFFGREIELAALDRAWATPCTNILSLVAWGGAGKSALVNHWLGNMAADNHRGAELAYGWSFFSQGTKETETSADEFFKAALAWFGDPEPEKGSPWQKGERLACLIQRERTLLVLDGLEPLQNPPGIEGGKLKDPALAELLRHLETNNPGLCLITTRLEVADIADRRHATAPVIDLGRLSSAAGSGLLEAIGVRGEPEEIAEAVEAVDGHALTLNLLGTYLRDILDRDARRWREAGLLESARYRDQRALHVMAAYERWFAGRPELAILRILGLFDRPVRRELVDVLRKPPVIAGLNDDVVNLPENEWRWASARLLQARLIEHEAGAVVDVHPLVREHFEARLKIERPEAWRAGHGRLYEYLRDSAKQLPNTLAEMAPLFQATRHACQAGRQQEALDGVYRARICRGDQFYATAVLGAFGEALSALASLFEPPWEKPVTSIDDVSKAFVLYQAGILLRGRGLLKEATTPMRLSLEMLVDQREYSIRADHLSELQLNLGEVTEAIVLAKKSVKHADQSGDLNRCQHALTTLAEAHHQAGKVARAARLFRMAETLQRELQPARQWLYSLRGYRYCDLLLDLGHHTEVCHRGTEAIRLSERDWSLGPALDRLALGRAMLLAWKADPSNDCGQAAAWLDEALERLRAAGDISHMPRGLLGRAALRRETGDFSAARDDLDEAMRIAERSEMRLHQCDVHLEYARLALARGDRETAREHVAEARRLVEETGYGRRRPEVEELEQALRS